MTIIKVAIGTTVASVGSSLLGSRAQRKATEKSGVVNKQISDESLALTKELAATQREDFQPWRNVGEQALKQLWSSVQAGEFEAGAIDVTRNPAYKFRMSEGVKAVDRSAAARGRLNSGAQQKALTRFAQGYASDEYARAYDRDANERARKFNVLSGLSGQGQASAAGQASTTGQLARNAGNILSNSGNAQAQITANAGRARASGYQDVATSVNRGAQNYLFYNLNKTQ